MNQIKTSIHLEADGRTFFCHIKDKDNSMLVKILDTQALYSYPKENLWDAVQKVSVDLFIENK